MTGLSVLRLLPEPAGRIVRGQVLLQGEDLVTKSEAEMRRGRGRRISMILQDPQTPLNPVFTIRDQPVEALTMLYSDAAPAPFHPAQEAPRSRKGAGPGAPM